MNFWEGKKIRLRTVEPGDADFFYRCNQDSLRARNLDFVWPPQSAAQVRAWAEAQSLKGFEDGAFFWVISTLDGLPAGTISTHHCQLTNGVFSYGVDVADEYRGRGFASEAIFLVLKYYFEELRYHKANIPVHADNPASIRLHEKLGFQLEGRLREVFYSGGCYLDELWFGMTIDEFHAKKWEAG